MTYKLAMNRQNFAQVGL